MYNIGRCIHCESDNMEYLGDAFSEYETGYVYKCLDCGKIQEQWDD